MAAKVDKVDMSLDDIIKMNRKKQFKNGTMVKSNRPNNNNNRTTKPQNQRKPNIVRKNPNLKTNQTVRRNPSAQFRPTSIKTGDKWKHDMFEGNKSARLMIGNLHFRVSDNDIKELFKEFGVIKRAAVHYDSTGRSLGNAEVIFANKISARKAIEKYNDVLLDGRKMKITLVSDKPTVSGISPKPAPRMRKPLAASGRISQGNRPRNGVKRIGGGRPQNRQTQNRKPKVNPKTREQLDAELDAYVSKN